MNCTEWKEELKSLLEKGWAFDVEKSDWEKPALPRHLEEHAESCPKCSATLRGALMLVGGKELKKSPQAGLIYRVRERVFMEAEPRGLSIPRWFAVPAAAAAVLVFAVILAFLFLKPNNHDTVMVHLFLEAPGASEVVVVGDWNGWDPLVNRLSDTDGDGIWEIEIKLQRSREYRYQFLIDGELWIPDPKAPLQIEDGFGGTDSILHI